MSNKVEFLFDYASPWAYLADHLLADDTSLDSAGVEIELVPIYLRGLEIFAKGMPYPASKLAYIAQDLTRCTRRFDLQLSIPETFPVNGLYTLRAALAAQKHGCFEQLHRPLFQATWRDGRNVSDPAVVLAVVEEAGLDKELIGASMVDGAIKQQLKTQTAAAQDRGVFGVPSFFVNDELFWGHDRLSYVLDAATAHPAAVKA